MPSNKKYYAGIGSRSSPPAVLAFFRSVGSWLAESGWILRSGGADGADTAFEQGCDSVNGEKEIFLPWQGFNGNMSSLFWNGDSDPALVSATNLASKIHPAWHRCSRGAKLLHARNVNQVLGGDVSSPAMYQPVRFVVCWTSDGGETGGTATAIRLAKQYGAKIFNFYNPDEPLLPNLDLLIDLIKFTNEVELELWKITN